MRGVDFVEKKKSRLVLYIKIHVHLGAFRFTIDMGWIMFGEKNTVNTEYGARRRIINEVTLGYLSDRNAY